MIITKIMSFDLLIWCMHQTTTLLYKQIYLNYNNQVCWGITIWLPTTTLKTGPQSVMLKAIKNLRVSSSSPISFEVKWHSSWSDKWYQSQVHDSSHASVIMREGLLGDHNSTSYNHFKNRLARRVVECHKRFECVILITSWFWGAMT